MRLLVTVDGKRGELQFDRNGNACTFGYRREGMEFARQEASIIECEPGIYSVVVNGRSYEAKVIQGGSGFYVDVGGHRSTVEVRDPRSLVRKGRAGVGEGVQNIIAPMPGKVVRVLVQEGDEVEAGAGLVVVEAMKMQNEMKSPKAGRVTHIQAREGETVSAGDILAAIE